MADSDYYDLGGHSWPQAGLSEEAQRWFDRALNWTYGYNHLEAVRCFDRCLAAQPGCAMAEWGAAYALGPNYNAPWNTMAEGAMKEMRHRAAAALGMAKSPLEVALTTALMLRYPQDSMQGSNVQEWDMSFADAMVKVAEEYADSADVQALAAEALMCITPWNLWDLKAGGPAPPPARTLEALRLLERACTTVKSRGQPPHPGLCHLFIHLLEMSPYPERALPHSDALVEMATGTGHLTHMPTHVYILCGEYYSAMLWNDRAAAADRQFLKREGDLTFYTLYCAHNVHFKMYAAMFLGHYGRAMEAVHEMEDLLPERLLRQPTPAGFPFVNIGDAFIALRYHVWVRFGRWQEILSHPLPQDAELYCATACTAHYARSLAHALGATPDLTLAEEERQAFEEAFASVPEDWQGVPGLGRRLHNNTCRDILSVARKVLEGELAYQHGRHDEAFELLREAGRLESSPPEGRMAYDEPWGFMQPSRHALGALLLEQNRLAEAEAAYREDLGLDPGVPRPHQHPDNVWALHGLCEALRRQDRPEEALERRLRLAAARADVEIAASCFCRRSACCPQGAAAPCSKI